MIYRLSVFMNVLKLNTMYKRSFTVVLCSLMSIVAMAQRIHGRIVDVDAHPLAYANVVLLAKTDSAFVCGTISNEDGRFELNSTARNGLIKISSIGYKLRYLDVQSDLENIELKTDAYNLPDVVISRSKISNNLKGYSVNLRNSPLKEGKNLTELLDFLPCVNYDGDKLRILNNPPSAVYVNGIKLTNLVELSSIPAAQIEKIAIEYMAGSDEAMNNQGGVLKITLKQPVIGGYSGWLETVSRHTAYGYGGNFTDGNCNLQLKNLSLYNTFVYNKDMRTTESKETKDFLDTDRTVALDSRLDKKLESFYDRLSAIYQLASHHTIGVSLSLDYEDLKPSTRSNITENQEVTSTLYKNHEHGTTIQSTGYYVWQLDDKNTQLRVDADYMNKDTHSHQYTNDISTLHADQQTAMYRVKPMLSGIAFGGGFKVGGDFHYIHFEDNQAPIDADMRGVAPAVFLEYQAKIGQRLMYMAGLRYQYNQMKVNQGEQATSTSNSGVYPSIQAMYMLNPQKGHMLNFMFNYSTDDMPYSAVSTYKRFTSPYHYVVGNPHLDIPTQWHLMTMLKLFNKYTITLGTHRAMDYIDYTTKIDENGISYDTPVNNKWIAFHNIGLETNLHVCKWWEMKPHAELMLTSGNWEGRKLHNDRHWKFNINNSFNFSPTAGAQLKASYDSPYEWGNVSCKKTMEVGGSVYKSMLHKKLHLKLRYTLYQRELDYKTTTDTYRSYLDRHSKNARVSIAITWNFSGGKKSVKQDDTNSIQQYKKIEPKR